MPNICEQRNYFKVYTHALPIFKILRDLRF
jgi:hypothetical protein